MKIGVLTFHYSYNFGANLQALATQEALRGLGVEAEIVDYRNPSKVKAYDTLVNQQQAKEHEDFFNRKLALSKQLNASSEVEEYCTRNLKAVLVGSDAVFRLSPKHDWKSNLRRALGKSDYFTQPSLELEPYWLNWRDDKRVFKASISASSMGTKYRKLDKSLYPKLKESLLKFDRINVRDSWTLKMVKHLCPSYSNDINELPDPVFSLSKNSACVKSEVDERISKTILLSGNYSQQWLATFRQLCNEKGYLVANLPSPENFHLQCGLDYTFEQPISPEYWYQMIANCAGYVGVRFHPLVICISNSVPFVNLANPRKADFGYTKRCKEYDLCRRSGNLDKHLTLAKANRIGANQIFRKLIAQIESRGEQAYSSYAKKAFMNEVTTIVKATSSKTPDDI